MKNGIVRRVTGPVVDVQFPTGHLPDIYNAIEIQLEDRKVVMEAMQQLVAGVQNALRRQAKQVLHPVADMGIHQPRQPQMRHIVIIQPHGAVVRFGKEFVQHFVHSATSLLPSL